jgi:UDP:flavonoid glycosyltransferase YjiC (YdhE family)
VAKLLIVATGGAGGDLPPLVAAALALRERGNETVFAADIAVQRMLHPLGIEVDLLPGELDLGPRMASVVQKAMQETGGDLGLAGPLLQRGMTVWAHDVALPIGELIERHRPSAIVTSLFGVEAVDAACPPCPWAVINSTFYVGPRLQRPIEQDFGPRAIPLIQRYIELLEAPNLVLHATDQLFDYGFQGLPARHHYVGPLGIWEPPSEPPAYLREPGDPWVLVSISTQRQDDLPLAEHALAALADQPVRVLLTVGAEHSPAELADHPANTHVEATVSHAAVLKNGALLISHAGHGSVMKALWYGRPMVLIPWGRDQPGVAARAAALGVAEVVPRGEAGAQRIGLALDRVQHDNEMARRAAGHAARLQLTDPPALAASLLESLS